MVQSSNINNLYKKYGVDRATPTIAGEYHTTGRNREVEITLNLADLTETETILADNTWLPAGMRIQEVEVVTETAAATGTAIDLGTIRDDRSTEGDYNGFLAAFPTANMNAAGETSIMRPSVTVPTGLTGTGALVGATLTTSTAGYLSASRTDATAFTAGKLKIIIRMYRP